MVYKNRSVSYLSELCNIDENIPWQENIFIYA